MKKGYEVDFEDQYNRTVQDFFFVSSEKINLEKIEKKYNVKLIPEIEEEKTYVYKVILNA